jgi:CBS domain-containing protein
MDESELLPIRNFLAEIAPFNELPAELLEECSRSVSIGYYSKVSGSVPLSSENPMLYIVRSGAFEVRNAEGELLDRLGAGDYFGFPSLMSGESISNKVLILEDGLVYHLTLSLFEKLRAGCRAFDRFFNRAYAKRLRHQKASHNVALMTANRISSLMVMAPVSVDHKTPVCDAAKLMRKHRVSSALVIDNQKLVGILTDRDLRNRVLAEGLNGNVPVYQAMTSAPVTIDANALVFEAMLQMSQHNIHHLPVLENGQPVGMVTSTDIIRSQSSQPIFLIGEIERQQDVASLIHVSKQIPLLLQNLIGADARAEEIGRILTSVTDALTRRLIQLNQALLGEPPLAFCWLAFGSQGRQDQMACSDQDNGLLLAKEPDAAATAYFDALTHAVCSGLNDCGYVFCPGDIMAQNPAWRMSLENWQQKFSGWVNTPEPKALMHASIFFDMRCVFGPESLFKALQNQVLANTCDNDIFLAALAGNALSESPPLGFFRQFVLERDGSEEKGIDLKHRGSVLINDIARVYALSAGINEVNTAKRIRVLIAQGILTRKDGLNLADALEFIAHMRLANQGRQYENREALSNYLRPQALSSLMRHQLRDAFKVVHDAQAALKLKFMRSF